MHQRASRQLEAKNTAIPIPDRHAAYFKCTDLLLQLKRRVVLLLTGLVVTG
jgi:hypothetical protein